MGSGLRVIYWTGNWTKNEVPTAGTHVQNTKLKKGKAVATGYSDSPLRLQRPLRNCGSDTKGVNRGVTYSFVD